MPQTRQLDHALLAVTVGAAAVGVVMVGSASGPLAREYYHIWEYEFAMRQLVAMVLGFAGMLAATFVPLDRILGPKVAFPLLATTWIALAVAYLQAPVAGTHRWLQLPVSSIQPSAIAKVTLPLALAALLGRPYGDRRERSRAQQQALVVTALTVGLVLLEPDMGSALLLLAAAASVLLLADLPLRPLFAMAGAAAVVFAVFALLRPYRVERLRTFFGDTSYQVQQSLIAIGGGGLAGRGLGNGLQKLFYLPQPHTDFLFAVIGEELGLIGTIGTLTLLGAGLAVTLAVQALLNVSVCLKLLPAKGLPLPLLSAGGSDVMLTLVAIGLLLNIGKEGA